MHFRIIAICRNKSEFARMTLCSISMALVARQPLLTGTSCGDSAPCTPEVTMESFIHRQKLVTYRRLIAESERDPARDQVQHNWLLKLLADEEAMDAKPP